MTGVTYQNSSQEITIEDCMQLHELGIAVYITDGRHVTFIREEDAHEIETLPEV